MEEPERIVLYYRKSTPGTHVFENKADDVCIPSVYVKKWAKFLKGTTPKGIVLTAAILPEEEVLK